MARGWRDWLPAKITSSIEDPRRLFTLCSPSTHEIASEMLLLPQPLGPTMPVTPPWNETSCRSQKDLKPTISTFSRRMDTPTGCELHGKLAQGQAQYQVTLEVPGTASPSDAMTESGAGCGKARSEAA